MAKILIKNGLVINRGKSAYRDVLIKGERIDQISDKIAAPGAIEINAEGKWVMPGIIDDQVHFREPGLTHKADIFSESRAALAGGVTSFMEMPNTKPPATTQEKLEEKYQIGARSSITNYSFFMGTTNDNLDEVLRTDETQVCGIKIFMGSSTGNMLVDNPGTLNKVFEKAHMLIATHCEDEATIHRNLEKFIDHPNLHARHHPIIRSREGCILSSRMAIDLAKTYGTRLHILHISTAEETQLFDNSLPLSEKHITAEACVHHLFFNADDYDRLGNFIKCNPAIKDRTDQLAIMEAVLADRIDVIATDHAPHTFEEKSQPYSKAPSGLPLVQHSLVIMLDFYHRNMISKERIVEKMCHNPAILFRIVDRGYIDEGYFADVVIVDPEKALTVDKAGLRYKCGWSPLEGMTFRGTVTHSIINGILKYQDGRIVDESPGRRLLFSGN
jgi:dihydroorotase